MMKVAVLNPAEENLTIVVDDLPDLLEQSITYLLIDLGITSAYDKEFYQDLAKLVINVHSLYIPMVDDMIEIEIIRNEDNYIFKCHMMDAEESVLCGLVTVQADNDELLTL